MYEEVQMRIDVMRVGWVSKADCVEVVWTHGRLVGEENNVISCKWCEIERNTTNRTD